MPAGRPSRGLGHVDHLSGPSESKRRLRVVLETLSGQRTVGEACELLGVNESRFHQLRQTALEGALTALAPRPAGRRRKPIPAESSRIAELEAQVLDLRVDLQASRTRTEIALVMPHLLQESKKNPQQQAKVKRRRGKR